MDKRSIPYEVGLHKRLQDPIHAWNYIREAAIDSPAAFRLAIMDWLRSMRPRKAK